MKGEKKTLLLFSLDTQVKSRLVFSFYPKFSVSAPSFPPRKAVGEKWERMPQVMVNEELNTSQIKTHRYSDTMGSSKT